MTFIDDKEKRTFIFQLTTEAESFIMQQNKDEALKCFDVILEKYPDELSILYRKGMVHFEFGELTKALNYFEKVLAINPKEIDSLYAKGAILSNHKKHEEAITIYNQVLEIDAAFDVAWLAKGYALLEMGQAEEALECFEKLEKLGQVADIYNGKGHALRLMDRDNEAKECYEAILKIDPYDPEALFGLGAIAFQKNELKEALDYLYKSVVQDEDNLEAWKILADVYTGLNMPDKKKVVLAKIDELTNNER